MRNILFVILLCLTAQLKAQNIPLDPAVSTGRLSNGFTYYIRHNQEPKNRVQLYLVSNVGSILEDEDQQGLAHFMEHMNFNGTKNFPKNELVDYLQKAGVRFGADLNAHTGTDETVYQLPIPSNDPLLLANGLKIMRDWAQEATLAPTEIEKERGIVLEEGRLAKGSKDRMAHQYYPMMLNGSRYVKRLPIGLEKILTSFKPATIKRFHQDWYRPDLQALIVVGDINVNSIEELIKKHFSDLKNPVNKRERINYTIPLSGKIQFMVVTDHEMSGTTLQVLFKRKAPVLKTESDYLIHIKRALFSKMLAARRYSEINRQDNPSYLNMGMSIQPLAGGIEAFIFNTEAKEGQLKNAFEQSWTFLEKLKRFGFTAAELKQASEQYLRSFQSALAEKDKTPSVNYATEYQNLFLHQQAAPGMEWEASYVKNHIHEVTVEALNTMLRDLLKPINRDILILAADKEKAALPDAATVASWMDSVAKSTILPFKEEQIATELMDIKPVSGKVIEKQIIPELEVTLLTLSNGLKVVLKPTAFKNDQILFKGFSSGGTSLYDEAEFDNATNAAPLISNFGLGDFNPAQLNQVLNNKVLSVSASIGPRSDVISGSSTVSDLETALQIVYLQFTRPRKDSTIFKNIISKAKEDIKMRYADPGNVFTDSINYVLSNYSYRFSPLTTARLDKIDLKKVYSIYKDRFADAAGFTFVFTGSFNSTSIVPLIEQYLGSLPSLYRNQKARDLGIHIPEGKHIKKVYKGSENKATVRMIFSGNYNYSTQNNQLLHALGDVLQIKVLQKLREADGEVYSPSVQTTFTKYPKSRYGLFFTLGCAPVNAAHLIEEVNKEMEVIRTQGVSLADIQKYKAAYRKNVELAMKDNAYWLNYLAGQYENAEDILEVLSTEQALEMVTPENLKKAASLFLSPENSIQFILLPETAKTNNAL
jgi:zinc protease